MVQTRSRFRSHNGRDMRKQINEMCLRVEAIICNAMPSERWPRQDYSIRF